MQVGWLAGELRVKYTASPTSSHQTKREPFDSLRFPVGRSIGIVLEAFRLITMFSFDLACPPSPCERRYRLPGAALLARLVWGLRYHGACALQTIPCSVAYTRYQADLGSPFVPLPLRIVTGSRVVNYRQANVYLIGQPWTQALGRVLVRVTLLHWGLEFRQ
jgi:hypothetical protein